MKIKHLVIGLLSAIILFAFTPSSSFRSSVNSVNVLEEESAFESDNYKVDIEKSTVGWYGKKAIVSGEHNGSVSLKSGVLSMEGSNLVGGSFVIDMNSITNEDIKDKKNNGKLVGHLKSADFFDVSKFPEASLTIKSVKGATVTADATVKGITKEITFKVALSEKEGVVTATADIALNRTEFGVQYGSKSFFSDLVDAYVIDDNIKLTVSLIAAK